MNDLKKLLPDEKHLSAVDLRKLLANERSAILGAQAAQAEDLYRGLETRTQLVIDSSCVPVSVLRPRFCSNSSCVPVSALVPVSAPLENGGTIQHAQQIANHESPKTTKLYDRTTDQITLDEVEKIAI
jgi:hypothetical protein